MAAALTWTTAGIGMAPDFHVTVIDANNFTLNEVSSIRWQTYISGGVVGKSIRIATSSLPFKRVVANGMQVPYITQLPQFITGTNYVGKGTPYSFVYNAAADVLLYTLSPADDGGQLLGIPLEVIVQLCNECDVAPWVCIPMNATDDFVLQTANYLFENLNSNLRVRIEYGNEMWNGSFVQWNYSNVQGGLAFGLTSAPNTFQPNQAASPTWVGYRFYTMMAQVDAVYAGAMNRVYRVLAVNTFSASKTYTDWVLKAVGTGLTPAKPADRADALAIAPYIEVNRNIYPTAQAVYQYKTGSIPAAFTAVDSWFNSVGGGIISLRDWRNIYCPFWAGIRVYSMASRCICTKAGGEFIHSPIISQPVMIQVQVPSH